jgi:hypothetical protein
MYVTCMRVRVTTVDFHKQQMLNIIGMYLHSCPVIQHANRNFSIIIRGHKICVLIPSTNFI